MGTHFLHYVQQSFTVPGHWLRDDYEDIRIVKLVARSELLDSFEDSANREEGVRDNSVRMLVTIADVRKSAALWERWQLFLLQLEVIAQEAFGNVASPRDPKKAPGIRTLCGHTTNGPLP